MVFFGRSGGQEAEFYIHSLDSSDGFLLSGDKDNDLVGLSVSSAGDVNGDGFDDFLASGSGQNGGGGATYLVFGTDASVPSQFDISELDGEKGARFVGEGTYSSGFDVAAAGDVNGDGLADLIISALGAAPSGPDSGASYVVFGKSEFEQSIDLSSLDGTDGFQINGEAAGDRFGLAVSSAGDFNGDGLSDLLVGAPGAGNAGAAYVIFGKQSGFGPEFDVSSLDGKDGFKINEDGDNEFTGASVTSAGDVNGDGFGDILIGTIANYNIPGKVYVVFGRAKGFNSTLQLSTLDGTNGFAIQGESKYAGFGNVASAGDVNRDGFSDILVSAPEASSTYVIFGRAPDTAVNRIGSAASQKIMGGAFDDTLSGRGGADTLDGGSGDDTMRGGQGADTYFIGSNGDVMEETGRSGGDRVISFIDFALGEKVEELLLAGTDNTDANGNDRANFIGGNRGANLIAGQAGNDTIEGGGGEDSIDGGDDRDDIDGGDKSDSLDGAANRDLVSGGVGNDTIVGGLGRDDLTGGKNKDLFVFEVLADSGTTLATRDLVTDFNAGTAVAFVDRIDLRAIDADERIVDDQSFEFIGDAIFTLGIAGQLRVFQAGDNTLIAGDVDGDAIADFEIALQGLINLTKFDSNDFFL